MKYVTHYKKNTYKFDDIDLAILCLIVGCSKTEEERKDFEFMPSLFKKLLAALRSNSQKEFQHAIRLLLVKLHPDKIRSVKTMQGMYKRVIYGNTILKEYITSKAGFEDNFDVFSVNFVATSITKTFNAIHSSYNFTYRLFGDKRDDINTAVKFLDEFLVEQDYNPTDQSPAHTAMLSQEYSFQELAAIEKEHIERDQLEKARVAAERIRKERAERERLWEENRRAQRANEDLYNQLYLCGAMVFSVVLGISINSLIIYLISPDVFSYMVSNLHIVLENTDLTSASVMNSFLKTISDVVCISESMVSSFFVYGPSYLASILNLSKYFLPNILEQAHLASDPGALQDTIAVAAPILASNSLFEHIYAASIYLKLQLVSTGAEAIDYVCNIPLSIIGFFNTYGDSLKIGAALTLFIIGIIFMPEPLQYAAAFAPVVVPMYYAAMTSLLIICGFVSLYNKITSEKDFPTDEVSDQKTLAIPDDLPKNDTSIEIPNSKKTNYADDNISGTTTSQDLEAENRILAARNEAESLRAMEEQRKTNIQTINHIIPETLGRGKLRVSI